MLHPHPNIPTSVRPKIPFLGTLLISPWVCLAGDESFNINDPYDITSAHAFHSWGNTVLQHVDTQFGDPVGFSALKNWFDGVHELVGNVLVMSKVKECMYVEFIVMDGVTGVHDHMLFNFVITGEKTENLSPTTAVIVDCTKNVVLDLANMDFSSGPDNTAILQPPMWADPYSLAQNDEGRVRVKKGREWVEELDEDGDNKPKECESVTEWTKPTCMLNERPCIGWDA
ncbi:hypothetical protein ARMGADRAFT_1035868 [Armillaria gallica]|uniref:Uncharacterized protein n=1 Tax=Armillaria gallica TaxID=47427 RepID=A0A2H3CWF2_ARMGA|nr:hypothetical protein ARMGADRAFT_1035868 [Armillaria gallica]